MIYSTYGWRRSRLAGSDVTGSRNRIHVALMAVAILAFIPTLIVAVRVFGRTAG